MITLTDYERLLYLKGLELNNFKDAKSIIEKEFIINLGKKYFINKI